MGELIQTGVFGEICPCLVLVIISGQGITPEFWANCDAICGPEEWDYQGTFHCGKGEPGQAMHLSHGVAPARFKDIVCNVKA